MNNKYYEMKKEAIENIIETLENGYDGYYCDLHNEVFNTDYYICDVALAKDTLREYNVFDAIEKVLEYERFNFGEVYTDVSDPEKLVNMLFYIIGDEVIGEMYNIPEFDDNWNNNAEEETNHIIIEKLKKEVSSL